MEAEATATGGEPDVAEIQYLDYENEDDLKEMTQLIEADLSEPYSVYTYRYFVNNNPRLTLKAVLAGRIVGCIICRLEPHGKAALMRGYIAMLAVSPGLRRRGVATQLVQRAVRRMINLGADEVVLETEKHNTAALQLYQSLGFIRDKRLHRYYLKGQDAFRLKLTLTQNGTLV